MKLTPYQKADMLSWLAIAMGMAAIFPMTQAVAEAFWAPTFNTRVETSNWSFWLSLGWMGAMVYIGLVLPERYLRRAHENWRQRLDEE